MNEKKHLGIAASGIVFEAHPQSTDNSPALKSG